MKKITRDFTPADRYLYDFGPCTTAKGWAQIDTSQDASYFGQWVNPARRLVFSYVEGDCILVSLDTDEELRAEFAEMKQWNETQGYRFMGIDPGFNPELKTALVSAGLQEYIH
jgi:hypothetical protein